MSNLQMWYNGEFLDADKAQVSLLEHGLHYGTGVFEGIRCYETKRGPAVFRLGDHLARMVEGAKRSICLLMFTRCTKPFWICSRAMR